MKMKGEDFVKIKSIYHITEEKTWLEGLENGSYKPQGIPQDGFIHCSSREQVLKVANSFYRGQAGLVLLVIDIEKVAAEIKWENLEGGIEQFPHIYGSLNLEAVSSIHAFPPQLDGSFVFPST